MSKIRVFHPSFYCLKCSVVKCNIGNCCRIFLIETIVKCFDLKNLKYLDFKFRRLSEEEVVIYFQRQDPGLTQQLQIKIWSKAA